MSLLKSIAATAAVALIGFSANAATYTPDNLLFDVTLPNSGDATELQALADYLAVDVATLTLSEKTDYSDLIVQQDDGGNWFIDVAPDTPGYFYLKFGNGGTTANSHYYFENVAQLDKLVWAGWQVSDLMKPECASASEGSDCRLSHIGYTGDVPVNVIPVPAAGFLLLGALGGLVGLRRRKS